MTIKRKFFKCLRSLRSMSGNTVAEYTVTTAMMATLGAIAAPKISENTEQNTMLSIRESADLYKEVTQLSSQRDVLKEEIFELLVSQNEILMQKVANNNMQNNAIGYLGDASSELYESETSESYDSEYYDYGDDTEDYQYDLNNN